MNVHCMFSFKKRRLITRNTLQERCADPKVSVFDPIGANKRTILISLRYSIYDLRSSRYWTSMSHKERGERERDKSSSLFRSYLLTHLRKMKVEKWPCTIWTCSSSVVVQNRPRKEKILRLDRTDVRTRQYRCPVNNCLSREISLETLT